MEAKLLAAIVDKFKTVKGEVCKESRSRYESVEQLKLCLENDFPRLQEMIKTERA